MIVSVFISRELSHPKLPVIIWYLAVLLTHMPKATIYEKKQPVVYKIRNQDDQTISGFFSNPLYGFL
jgi:hypothetical protein